jgi:AcrR family transcriptional regulator
MIYAVGRWDPGARTRLTQAAMKLYAERGFDQTTVAEIAREAGLTERTFFRHFADKREVLFSGAAQLQELMVGAVRNAPADAPPMDVAAAGVEAAATVLQDRNYSRMRQALIAKNPILQERELIKMASLAAAFADALRQRGVRDPAASVTAEAGIAVFRISFERWVLGADQRDFLGLIRETFEELKLSVSRR